MSTAKNPSQIWSELIIDQLIKNGITDFFVCPGMRNAPLLRAISIHPGAYIHRGVDERAQSYCALTRSKITKRASVLVCTSGTALANFLPAVIEAKKSRVPLIVLSADRPGELSGSDSNQTIDQIEVLRNYTDSFWHLSEPHADYPPRALASELCHHISNAGLVHLNIPLRAPLDETDYPIDMNWKEQICAILSEKKPALSIAPINQHISEDVIIDIAKLINGAKNPLIVFGQLDNAIDEALLRQFLETLDCNFACDITGMHKFTFGTCDGLIPGLDHPEVLANLKDRHFDVIIHVGHRQTSKHYYSFLSQMRSQGARIIQICKTHFHEDPGHAFSERFNVSLDSIIEKLMHNLSPKKREKVDFSSMVEKKSNLIDDSALSYAFLSKQAVNILYNCSALFIGNSTFIRSFDSYCTLKGKGRTPQVIAHRGASGIEGHLASAYTMAKSHQAPSAAFIGDISTLHDLGSLSYYHSSPVNQLVVIVNNQSGGIFSLLPIGTSKASYLDLLTTPHTIDFTTLINSLNLECKKISTKLEYVKACEQWRDHPRLLFLEVMIDNDENLEVYKQLKTIKL